MTRRFLVLMILARSAFAAQAAPHRGLSGEVVNAITHQAVRRAVVSATTNDDIRYAFTDADGRFHLADLASGDYTLIVHRDLFTDAKITIGPLQFDSPNAVRIEVFPQGLIAGRVIDGNGEGLPARIEALGSRSADGKMEVVARVEANDLGEYRLSGLDPGKYQLRATVRTGGRSEFDATPVAMASAYHGGAAQPTQFNLKAGETIDGINFLLDPHKPASIHGVIRASDGSPVENASMWIKGHAGERDQSAFGRNGEFEISNVPPGTYTISATTYNLPVTEFGSVVVTVTGSDLDNVVLRTKPGLRVDGRVKINGPTPREFVRSVFFHRQGGNRAFDIVSAELRAFDIVLAELNDLGSFVAGLPPGFYKIGFLTGGTEPRITVEADGRALPDLTLRIEDSSKPITLSIVLEFPSKP